MNVRELIEALGKMPPDALVKHLWDGLTGYVIDYVWLAQGGYVVTAEIGEPVYYSKDRPIGAPSVKEDPYWKAWEDD
jgi:hypothetical protein